MYLSLIKEKQAFYLNVQTIIIFLKEKVVCNSTATFATFYLLTQNILSPMYNFVLIHISDFSGAGY